MTKEIEAFGMSWTYTANRCYRGVYRGHEIVLRRIPKTRNGMNWRLVVHREGDTGIGLAFNHQFYKNSIDARSEGIAMVDAALDNENFLPSVDQPRGVNS